MKVVNNGMKNKRLVQDDNYPLLFGTIDIFRE
jgi:hypothetical protein